MKFNITHAKIHAEINEARGLISFLSKFVEKEHKKMVVFRTGANGSFYAQNNVVNIDVDEAIDFLNNYEKRLDLKDEYLSLLEKIRADLVKHKCKVPDTTDVYTLDMVNVTPQHTTTRRKLELVKERADSMRNRRKEFIKRWNSDIKRIFKEY